MIVCKHLHLTNNYNTEMIQETYFHEILLSSTSKSPVYGRIVTKFDKTDESRFIHS